MSGVFFEPLRTLPAASISAVYAALGVPTSHLGRAMCITNTTDGDLILSFDNTVVEGQIFVPAGGFKLWDFEANINPRVDDKYVLAQQKQLYVKQSTAPTTGDVWMELLI